MPLLSTGKASRRERDNPFRPVRKPHNPRTRPPRDDAAACAAVRRPAPPAPRPTLPWWPGATAALKSGNTKKVRGQGSSRAGLDWGGRRLPAQPPLEWSIFRDGRIHLICPRQDSTLKVVQLF